MKRRSNFRATQVVRRKARKARGAKAGIGKPIRPTAKVKSRGPRMPAAALETMRRLGISPTPRLLTVSVARQEVFLFEQAAGSKARPAHYVFRDRYIASTSRFGIGQKRGSNRTPLGLHRIAQKIGGDQPVGTVFKGRKPIGVLGDGKTDESIVHRILWLEGLEPGLNQGGEVDTFKRYIYIHGFGDETTLGRPMSRGCVHLAAADLIPLYDGVDVGTLVWIGER